MLTAFLLAAAAPPAEFRPDLFFAGRTRGTGTVRIATSSRPRALAVTSFGRVEPDGTLVLDQDVRIDGKAERRSFRIRRTGPGIWTGTLSDAAGPVRASVKGNTLRLNYATKRGGTRMKQVLVLQPGGRRVLNRATVTLLGIGVARIDEVIEKID